MDNKKSWNENVILIDSRYADEVALNLTVNFERMLNRRINQADVAHWLDCLVLDGGIREGENNIDVVFVHPENMTAFDNFNPSDFKDNLNDKAFKDNLGEFNLYSFGSGKIVDYDDFFFETLQILVDAKEVKKLLVVGDTERNMNEILHAVRNVSGKECVLFGMQPLMPGTYKQEILGYSLMSALGINSDEIARAK